MDSNNLWETDIDQEYTKQNAQNKNQALVIDEQLSVKYNAHTEENNNNNDSPDVYHPTWQPMVRKPTQITNYERIPGPDGEGMINVYIFNECFEIVHMDVNTPMSAYTEPKNTHHQNSEWLDQEPFEMVDMNFQTPIRVDTVKDAEQLLIDAVADMEL